MSTAQLSKPAVVSKPNKPVTKSADDIEKKTASSRSTEREADGEEIDIEVALDGMSKDGVQTEDVKPRRKVCTSLVRLYAKALLTYHNLCSIIRRNPPTGKIGQKVANTTVSSGRSSIKRFWKHSEYSLSATCVPVQQNTNFTSRKAGIWRLCGAVRTQNAGP